MITGNQLDQLAGRSVHGSDGEKIGKVVDVYASTDGQTGTFVTVSTGLFGNGASFVPLDQAQLSGDDLTVPYTKDQVKDAPRVDNDEELTAPEEDRLYGHYGLSDGTTTGTTDYTDTSTETVAPVATDTVAAAPRAEDGSLTVSQERLQVGTQTRESGRARLKKYVTTEMKTVQVPVSHEEVRVVREDVAAGETGDSIQEGEVEVTLHEEVPVVGKETVTKERVRLETDRVTDTQAVSDEVREEHIEVDGVRDKA